ncbi:MAG: hypothetical protein KatS3mg110_4611 [Pirellulaceae bacterium]|nr:MAG: hypothetical protein KatS3mg110_4611 [Pirellulaceae bacterium]
MVNGLAGRDAITYRFAVRKELPDLSGLSVLSSLCARYKRHIFLRDFRENTSNRRA